MISARVVLEPYANKVLNVVKAKYDLKDKSEALNKFIEIYGENEVEPELREDYVARVKDIEKRHFAKYGYKKMTRKELDRLFGK